MKEIGDRLDGKPVPTVTAGASTSLTFDDDGPVVGALVSMLPHLAIGGAVIPSLGLVEGGKLEYDHAFDRRTLKDFLAAIVCAGCDGVAGQRGRDILRIGVKLRLVAGSLAREDYIGDHVLYPYFKGNQMSERSVVLLRAT